MSIIQNLQQNIEYIRMCLFNFIKKENRIRMCPDLVTELSTFFMTDISRRGTDHL